MNRPHLDESTTIQFMIFHHFSEGSGFFSIRKGMLLGDLPVTLGEFRTKLLGMGGSLCGGIVPEEIANTYIVQAMLNSKHNEDMTHMTNLNHITSYNHKH